MSKKLKSDTFLANMWGGSLEQSAGELSSGSSVTSFGAFTTIDAYQNLKENEATGLTAVQRLGTQLSKDAEVLQKFAGEFEAMDLMAGRNAAFMGR